MALGMRQAHAAVHTAELQLARERSIMAEQERQVVHDLTNSMAEVDRSFSVAQTNLMRYHTTGSLVELLVQRLKEGGNLDFDRLLDAQRRLAEAESSFFLSQVEFEVAMKNLYYERNAILDYYGLSVMDGVDDDTASNSKLTLMKSQAAGMPPATVVPAAPAAPPATLQQNPASAPLPADESAPVPEPDAQED